MALNIGRINELARKAKTEGLTEEEKEEQKRLRREYIDSVVGNLRSQLERSPSYTSTNRAKVICSNSTIRKPYSFATANAPISTERNTTFSAKRFTGPGCDCVRRTTSC